MITKLRALIIAMLIFQMALLSALHAHVFAFWHLDYDIDSGQWLVGVVTFALTLLLQMPRSKLLLLGCVFCLPLLCAISFSWGELLTELDPHNNSKGWGILWFILSYISSFGGLIAALIIKWLVFKYRQSRCSKDMQP